MPIATRRFLPAIFALALLILATAVSAQLAGPAYDLSWNTVDGGGGTSTGGTFTLSGTIGQPDASGPLTGGTFSLSGGFWPGAIPLNNCPSDINGDLQVNVNDLLAVITTWGGCPLPCPPRCAADISPPNVGNCQVDVNDLLLVITTWGACPP
jgi:hypothetical protein